jgi:hypothetical protein
MNCPEPETALKSEQQAMIEAAKRFASGIIRSAGIEPDQMDSIGKEACR